MVANPYTLIVSDVHQRVDKLHNNEHYRKLEKAATAVVFLGDYFDTHGSGDGVASVVDTYRFIESRITIPKFTFLIGNHDLQYMYKHPWLKVSGYQAERSQQLYGKLQWIVEQRGFRFHTWVGPYLLSHAGFHPTVLPDAPVKALKNILRDQEDAAYELLAAGALHPWVIPGADHCGLGYGSPTWLRWYNFQAIANVPQIVGHTYDKLLVRTNTHPVTGEVSYCLDTGNRHVALIDNQTNHVTIQTL